MAMRRCVSNAPAAALGLVPETDVSHQIASTWECHLRAALRTAGRSFRNNMASCIKNMRDAARADGPPAPTVAVSVHALRGDATNAQAWQKPEPHTL
eukprot:4332215-Pyramimonas_sp.AAC.1